MVDLVEWLVSENRDYSEGVRLFRELSNNRNLLRFFSSGENNRSKAVLYEQLEELRKHHNISLPIQNKVKIVKIAQSAEKLVLTFEDNKEEIEKPQVFVAEIPQLEELTKKHAYLFRQKEILRLSLWNFPKTNELEVVQERKMVIDQILNHKAQIADIALRRKFFEKNGFFPEEMTETKEQVLRKIGNARSNISRQKSAIKNAKSIEDKMKAEKRLSGYENELEELFKKMKDGKF